MGSEHSAHVIPRVVERERERRHPVALLLGPEIAQVWWRVVHVERIVGHVDRAVGIARPFRWSIAER